ncbi:uncharacterized protein FOMMEDRAFT_23908 [Fomitiporia mediterranea MF3/22]|uniref:uncharacterized protein n=1 Tax=Fomitiporia mediterranea (strain MF3/22) TaxID=694068 RepID=UPI00044077B2|nr:uncharacterized protein FOMMEDRAFT_23908 [Fomitiporia mediterranea MF3/22]EJC97842.1 hypothetical protein FOMMEDRAFT_23908 [Fomitiporia mediterranea MF3/22]
MTQEFKPMDYEDGQAAGHDTSAPLSAAQSGAPSNPVADSVSSLRALALSTLRPKRRKEPAGKRKAVPTIHPPVRPAAPTENTILLDYGTEASEEQIQAVSLDVVAGDKFSVDKAATPTEDEIKEEGEISDEDPDPLPTSPTSHANDTPASSSFRRPDNLQLTIIGSSTTTNDDRLMSSSSSFNEQAAILSSDSLRDYDLWTNWVPTEDEVRPGLRMNMEQFNLVKELILDLLGWGVSPEYLVDCGLTREAVFYTFTELNLRLPRNLDTTDLLPPLPRNGMARTVSSTLTQPAEVPTGISSSGTIQRSPEISSDARRPSLSHPLPLKPSIPQATSSTSLIPGPSGSQNRAIAQKLSDLEAQRKQELQARKAVLASRRKKDVPPASSEIVVPPMLSSAPSTVLDGPILEEPMPLAPTEAVDDFLKSMLETTTPSSQTAVSPPGPKGRTLSGGVALGIPFVTNAPASGTSSTSSTETHCAMDVDPGKAFKANRSPDQSVYAKSESPVSSVLPSASAQIDVEFSGSIAAAAQGDTSKGSTRPYTGLPSPSIPIFERPAKPMSVPASPTPGRLFKTKRGTKRPVAMDFVDLEQQPAISRTSAPSPVPPPFVRHKLSSFAGLGGHNSRRCVIDLTDSEDDGYGDTADEGVASAPEPASRSTNQATMSTAIPTTRPQSTRPQNTSGIVPIKSATPVISPASLAEKEQQIKRMKELIAKRERERLRKLAEVSVYSKRFLISPLLRGIPA